MTLEDTMKLKLIETWRKAHRYVTVQLAALLAAISTAWDYIPAVQQYLDPAWLKWFALAMIVARLVKQPSVSGDAAS